MNPLVEQFGNDKRWVTWKLATRKGKTTKVPYDIDGTMASSTDESTWNTYSTVKDFSDNVGIVFTPAQDLLGIDIDHCLKDNEIVHEQKEVIEKLIKEANTYTEISPSGEGLHIFLKISGGKFTLLSNRHSPYEAYTSGRYFTVTTNSYRESKSIREVTQDEANKLLLIIGYPWKKEESTNGQVELPTVHNAQKVDRSTSGQLTDSDVLEKMFSSRNGQKIREVYEKAKGNSEDDLALCAHLAFWTGKNALQMNRLWLNSPLGSRKKTQQRQDYRDRTIGMAIRNTKDVYETPAMRIEKVDIELELDLLYTVNQKKDKVYTQNTENMCRILRKHPDFKDRLRYDEFKNTVEYKQAGTNKWRNLEDAEAIDIQTQIQVLFPCFGRVGKEMVWDAMIKVSRDNAIDSAADFMRSLKWDGVARLDTWFGNVYGTENDAYHKAVASNWMKGMVKRIMHPGCKFDYVLVLEGPQGSKKSTSLYVLGADWHVETTMSTDSKDFFMQFAGKAIIEFSEGETMSRTEVKKMKAIITTQIDRYRQPWGRTSQDFPRRCVFAMTTNQEQYLKDETGNRRWLPIKVVFDEANVEWLETNREQLYAEAYYRVITKGESIYEFPREETLAAQDARRIEDPNADQIVDWYINKLTNEQRKIGITVHQVYRDVYNGGFNSRPMNRLEEMNISNALKLNLKLAKRRTMFNNVQAWRYFDDKEKYNEVQIEEEISVEDVSMED